MRSQIRTRIHTLSRPQIGTALVLALAASALLPVTGMAQAASAGIVGDRHGPPRSRSNAVVDWNATATQAAVTAGLSPDLDPLAESRLYAITAVAVHDALNAVDRAIVPTCPEIGTSGEVPRRRPRWRPPPVTSSYRALTRCVQNSATSRQ